MAIIIGTRRAVRASSPSDIVLMPLDGLRPIRFGEIVDVAAFDLIDGRVELSACHRGVVRQTVLAVLRPEPIDVRSHDMWSRDVA